jgi:hypothetical protein
MPGIGWGCSEYHKYHASKSRTFSEKGVRGKYGGDIVLFRIKAIYGKASWQTPDFVLERTKRRISAAPF